MPPKNCSDCIPITLRFATDRTPTKDRHGNPTLGTGRGDLEYGFCTVWAAAGIHYPKESIKVAVRDTFERGTLERVPRNLVTVSDTQVKSEDEFFDAVRTDLASEAGDATQRRSMIYVHGYADTYDEAAKRTAILANRIGWSGPKVFYTWPSMGSPTPLDNYLEDEQNAEWTEPHLANFLTLYLQRSGDTQVYLFAHSMGTRVLSRALVDIIAKTPDLASKISQVFLFAADMDADVFKEQIFPALDRAHIKVTVYGSSRDYAIEESTHLHGHDRLGQGHTDHTVFSTDEHYIDASEVSIPHPLSGDVGHAYIVDSATVLEDLYDRIAGKDDQDSQPASQGSAQYWVLHKIKGAETMTWLDGDKGKAKH